MTFKKKELVLLPCPPRARTRMDKLGKEAIWMLLLCLSLTFNFNLKLILASDADPLQDFCIADLSAKTVRVNGFICKDPKTVKASDFMFRGLASPGWTNNTFGSNVTVGNVERFAALNTLGISMNRVDFAPGGVNPPHVHPRATEIAFVVKGRLLVGFVDTNNVLWSQTLRAGDVFVFPRGLIHFQQNIGHGNAMTITAFNSQLPGAQILPFSLFASNPAIPDPVLTTALRIDNSLLQQIRSKFAP